MVISNQKPPYLNMFDVKNTMGYQNWGTFSEALRGREGFPLFSSILGIKHVSTKNRETPKMNPNFTFQGGFFIHAPFSTCIFGHHPPTICQPTRTPVKGSFFPTGPIDITIEATSTKEPRFFGAFGFVSPPRWVCLRKNPSKLPLPGRFLHLNAMILGGFRPSEIGILLQTYAVCALCVFFPIRAKGCCLLQIKRTVWEETSQYLGCDDSCFGASFFTKYIIF